LQAGVTDVRLEGVSKQYEGSAASRAALERLDLVIPSGEMAVLVGPSGCGKSTTLRIIAGLEEPTTGRVFLGEREVTDVPPARRDIAMVFQSYALYPHMSVFDNLAFALRMQKRPDAEIRERVTAAARALAIDEYLERRPKALSGGQRQRVAIGRAVVREPVVFLFDEPLSNLDAALRSEMRRLIARIHRQTGTTSLYVTHDQVEAMTLADRIVVLKDGRVQQVGTPEEIYHQPANRFVAGFFGTPAMSFFDADVGEASGALCARGSGFEVPLPLRIVSCPRVVVGVRPEAVALERRRADAAPLQGKVELREVLGAEVLLHLRSPAGALTVKTDARAAAREGESLTVWVDPSSLHLFDADTEMRV
jgi:ABC-type sugar transport system ATPase subunit